MLENTDPSLTLGDGTKTAPCRRARHRGQDKRCARGSPCRARCGHSSVGSAPPTGSGTPTPGPPRLPFCPSPAACHAVRSWVSALVAVLGTVHTLLPGLCGPRGQRDPDPGPNLGPDPGPTPARPAWAFAGSPHRWLGARCGRLAALGGGLALPAHRPGRRWARTGAAAASPGTGDTGGHQGTPGTRDTAAPAPAGHGRGGSAAAAGSGVRSGRAASGAGGAGGAGAEPRGSPSRGSPGRAGDRSGAGMSRGLAAWGGVPGGAAGGGERTPGAPGGSRCSRACPVPCRGQRGDSPGAAAVSRTGPSPGGFSL